MWCVHAAMQKFVVSKTFFFWKEMNTLNTNYFYVRIMTKVSTKNGKNNSNTTVFNINNKKCQHFTMICKGSF